MKYEDQEGNEDLTDYIKDEDPLVLNEDYEDVIGDYYYNTDDEDLPDEI